ncbi:MAG: serine hydrolase [Lachnospiraceae bacterium]|nr:serine hydrolase [Lachnospiraceae bacterium]
MTVSQFLLPAFFCCSQNVYASLTDDDNTQQTDPETTQASDEDPSAPALTTPAETEENAPAESLSQDTQDTDMADEDISDEATDESALPSSDGTIETNNISRWPQGPSISAGGAALIDADTGSVLYGKNMHERFYPASTTKILTTLIASEKCSLDETVKFSAKAVNSIERASSNMGIDIGQELTVEQCLYGILVYSANEVANAIGEHVSGSIEDFTDLMNKRASELGCLDSHFVTTNGLHDDAHYTTPYDLAMIGRAFFDNELLAKISGTNYYHISPTAHQPDEIDLYTHNQLTKGKYKYEGYVGGKTGYTTVAGQTLVTCAERDGMRLICVVMREDSPNQYLDTMTLFDYGFQNFSKVGISKQETRYTVKDLELFENSTLTGNRSFISIDPYSSILLPNTLSFDELDAFMSDYQDPDDATVIARINYSYENNPLGFADVRLADSGENFDFFAPSLNGSSTREKLVFVSIKKILIVFFGTFIVLLLFTILISSIKNISFAKKSTGQNLDFRKSERRRKTQSWQRRQMRAHKRMNNQKTDGIILTHDQRPGGRRKRNS